jgi:Putative DNA-binding domain
LIFNRNFCGFLNTGLGGVVYIGILDDGSVFGVRLTEYQKDHVLLDIQDTFQRFDPPVDETMYLVRFVPVLDLQDVQNGLANIPETALPTEQNEERENPHMLRTDRYCWCEKEALARHNMVSSLF